MTAAVMLPLSPVVFESSDVSSLSESEKKQFIQDIVSRFKSIGVTEEQARKILSEMTNTQVRTYLSTANADKSAVIALLDPEVQEMLGYDANLGVYGNPFGQIFIDLLILFASLDIEVRKMSSELSLLKLNESIAAAKDQLEGAKLSFAFAMVSAGAFIGTGAFAFYKLREAAINRDQMDPQSKAFDIQDTRWQWYGPAVPNALSQVFTAAGDFGKAQMEYLAALHQGDADLIDRAYQNLVEASRANSESEKGFAEGLAR